ncbi:MAG: CheY-like chemotaxis protein [Mariniflexile sp.]|jgi:CheY-like chemotaxis protein
MKNKLKCILLVDDDQNDNFFHERVIKKTSSSTIVIEKNTGQEALDYIKSNNGDKAILPDLIFLDINMPGMNGWDFLKEYDRLNKEIQSSVIIIMLTSSDNEDDLSRAKAWNFVSDYITKPLTKEVMTDIIKKYFD